MALAEGYGGYGGIGQFKRTPVRYFAAPPQQQQQQGPMMPPAQTAQPYVNPTQRQQQIYAHAMPQAMPSPGSGNNPQYDAALAIAHEQAKARVAQAAARYGQQRMGQLQQVSAFLPPELQQQLSGVSMVDPAAAWRAISGAFTTAAQGAGYADPRMWLQQLLMNRRNPQQQQPAGVSPTGVQQGIDSYGRTDMGPGIYN